MPREFEPGRTCKQCGKALLSCRHEGERVFVFPGDGHFCSQKCSHRWAVKMADMLEGKVK